jgi:nucleotide-binding universal stress UspA family protein
MAGTILCGVDESMEGRCAARVAAALSKQLELRLVLAHVGDAAADARRGCSTSLRPSKGSKESSSASRSVTLPNAHAAAEERAALILVGARRQVHRWHRRFRSDVTDDLPRLTPCPVFVVQPCTKDHAGRESLVLADP